MTNQTKKLVKKPVETGGQVMQLLEMAMKNSEVDLDKMEKIMAMYERFQTKEAEKAFHIAMGLFQANKPDLVKTVKVDYNTKTGHRVRYTFNPLPKIQKAIDPILSQYGLSYTWKRVVQDNGLEITCIISHVDGHSEQNTLFGPYDQSGSKNEIQAVGSTNMYLKRYTLENGLGLSSDEDDDGKSSDGSKPPRTLKELQGELDRCGGLDELKSLWEEMTKEEQAIASASVKVKKDEFADG